MSWPGSERVREWLRARVGDRGCRVGEPVGERGCQVGERWQWDFHEEGVYRGVTLEM